MIYQVFEYRLNRELLDATPLRERLLFKLGSSLDAFIVCHVSLHWLFKGENARVRLQPVADY